MDSKNIKNENTDEYNEFSKTSKLKMFFIVEITKTFLSPVVVIKNFLEKRF